MHLFLLVFVSLLLVSLFKTTYANLLLSTQLLAARKSPAPLVRGCTAVTLHHHSLSIQACLLCAVLLPISASTAAEASAPAARTLIKGMFLFFSKKMKTLKTKKLLGWTDTITRSSRGNAL